MYQEENNLVVVVLVDICPDSRFKTFVFSNYKDIEITTKRIFGDKKGSIYANEIFKVKEDKALDYFNTFLISKEPRNKIKVQGTPIKDCMIEYLQNRINELRREGISKQGEACLVISNREDFWRKKIPNCHNT
jgi:hypothetical protein